MHTDSPSVPRLAYSIADVQRATSLGHTKIHELIASGELRSVKVGGRRLIPVDAVAELLNGGAA